MDGLRLVDVPLGATSDEEEAWQAYRAMPKELKTEMRDIENSEQSNHSDVDADAQVLFDCQHAPLRLDGSPPHEPCRGP